MVNWYFRGISLVEKNKNNIGPTSMLSCNLLTFGYISLGQISSISRVHGFYWGKSPPLTILSRQLSLCSSFYWQKHRAVHIEKGCCPNKGLENHINYLHIRVCFLVCLLVSNKGRGEKLESNISKNIFFFSYLNGKLTFQLIN